MRRHLPGLAALGLLLLVSIALKFANTLAASEPDFQRMRIELAGALESGGYVAELASGEPKWWTDGLVLGRKGACEIIVRDATYFGPEVEAISSRRMNGGRPLRYIWGGKYITTYPRIGIEARWRTQRELARLGWRYGIDPVIAVGARAGCSPAPTLMRSVKIYYQK
jgi:hypothetical protein